jgi:hypothetical protein
MRRLPCLTAIVLVTTLSQMWSTLGQAQPQGPLGAPTCDRHGRLAEMLGQKFTEQPTGLGLQSNGQVLELFVANDGTSWTIVVTRPDGWSCIVAVGEHWEAVPDPVTSPLA